MSIIKKLASETASYGISTILGRSLNFLLVFIHTRAFMPEELGMNIKMYSWVAIANIVYTYSMETAFFRFAKGDDKTKIYNLTLSAIISTSIVFSGILIIFSTPIMKFLGYHQKEQFLIWLAIILAMDAIVAIPFARLRQEKQTKRFVTAKISNILINVFLNIFFLLGLKNIADGEYLHSLQPLAQKFYNPSIGAGYIFLANLIANACTFFFLIPYFKDFKFYFNKIEFKNLWVYAYPLMIMGLASTYNLVFDRTLLENLLPDHFYPNRTSEQALGIYGNVYKLSVFMSLAIQAFKYAAEPFFFSQTDKNSPKMLADVMKWFIIICVIFWLGICLNLDWLKTMFLKKAIYWEGIAVVPILLLANLFLGIYYNLSVWFKLNDKTHYGTMITFMGLVITVICNYFLIPQIGYMGCAVAFMISCFSMMVVCYYFGQKYAPVPYHINSALGYIVSAGILIYFSGKIHISNLWIALPYHILIFGIYLVGIIVVEHERVIPQRFKQKYPFLNNLK